MRVNVVAVQELCDQHLIAEHKDISRIPAMLMDGKLHFQCDRPFDYCPSGEGHLKFFTNKLRYLFARYQQLDDECVKRGLNVVYAWPQAFFNRSTLKYWDDYRPTRSAVFNNRKLLADKLPNKPKYSAYK